MFGAPPKMETLTNMVLPHTVEVFWADTLVSGQLYLRPPLQILVWTLIIQINSVFTHSCKRPAPVGKWRRFQHAPASLTYWGRESSGTGLRISMTSDTKDLDTNYSGSLSPHPTHPRAPYSTCYTAYDFFIPLTPSTSVLLKDGTSGT